MLELKNINFSVETENGNRKLLKDISLRINDASCTVITGPNGSGKSTLAKIIAGIYTPDSGQILLDGQDITGLSITQRAKAGISFAFQQPVRFKGLTIRDLISLAAGRMLDIDSTCQYLSEVGLCAKDYVNREANDSLSGGELKRIEIAMVIARKTKTSVFDEPEAGIDLWSFNNLIKVFEKMIAERASSIVIISHQERILETADQIVVLSDGVISEIGPKEEIFPQLMDTADECKFFKEATVL